MVGKKTIKMTGWGKTWRAVVAVIVPLVVGGVSAVLTMGTMQKFGQFKQPPLSPPAILFPIVWTILYALMGVASYLIAEAMCKNKKNAKLGKAALIIYGIQLVFNFFWSIFFFNLGWYWFALAWIIAMWVMILALVIISFRLSKGAFWCLLPYLLWVTFATYLNIGIAVLN